MYFRPQQLSEITRMDAGKSVILIPMAYEQDVTLLKMFCEGRRRTG